MAQAALLEEGTASKSSGSSGDNGMSKMVGLAATAQATSSIAKTVGSVTDSALNYQIEKAAQQTSEKATASNIMITQQQILDQQSSMPSRQLTYGADKSRAMTAGMRDTMANYANQLDSRRFAASQVARQLRQKREEFLIQSRMAVGVQAANERYKNLQQRYDQSYRANDQYMQTIERREAIKRTRITQDRLYATNQVQNDRAWRLSRLSNRRQSEAAAWAIREGHRKQSQSERSSWAADKALEENTRTLRLQNDSYLQMMSIFLK